MNKVLALCLLLLMSGSSLADVLGFSVGVNYWQYDMDCTMRSPLAANDSVGIGFDDASVNIFAAFEHPVPFLPNVRLQQNNIQAAGLIPVSDANFQNGEVVYVSGDIDLSHTDVTLYYEILDNWVNLDLGLTAKYFDGYSRFQYDTLIDDESDFDDWIPMVYGQAQFDLPFTGFSTAATVSALSFDSNHVTDLDLALKYQNKLGFGADLGYRTMDVDLKNINSFKSDLTIDGFYLGGRFEF